MAKLKLKVNIVSAINDLTSDRNKRIAYKRVMANPEAKREYGRRLVELIQDRTESGKDKDGVNMKSYAPYSKGYTESLAFEVYGKSKSKVNLKLTGAMLSAITVLSTDTTGVTLGFLDQTEEEKAIWHVNGEGNLPVRDFWGATKDEREDILKDTIAFFAGNDLAEAVGEINDSIDFGATQSNQQLTGEILFDEDF